MRQTMRCGVPLVMYTIGPTVWYGEHEWPSRRYWLVYSPIDYWRD